MKIKLQKFFIVCLIILTIFSPGLFTFTIIWQQHLELNQILNDELSYLTTTELPLSLSTSIMELFQQPNTAIFIQWLLFAVPFSWGIILFLHGRYLMYRATTHQKNVDILEQLYQQSIER
jgi:hypothetical protein